MADNSNIEGCVVVTGAASGIGRSICNELDKRGFRIALWDIEKEQLYETKAALSGQHKSYIVDISDYETISQIVPQVEAELGPINILINNAGINLGPCLFKKEPRENWMKVVNVNTIGLLNVTSIIYPLMAERKFGHIINISSVLGQEAQEVHVVFGAGKHFMEGFSQGLRKEGLPDNIKVTVVRPGSTRTNLGAWKVNDGKTKAVDEESKDIQDKHVQMLEERGLPWLTDPDQVGKIVAEIATFPKEVNINELNITSVGHPNILHF